MVSEKILLSQDKKPIGYELEGVVVDTEDCGVTIEIRPSRNKSAIAEIQNFEGDFKDRPHAKWGPGTKLRVLVIGECSADIITFKSRKRR